MVRKPAVTLADINSPQLTGPRIDILEKMPVDILEIAEIEWSF